MKYAHLALTKSAFSDKLEISEDLEYYCTPQDTD